VLGLSPDSFKVEIDKRPAPVESASYAGSDPYAETLAPEAAASLGLPPPSPGRLVLLFIERDAAVGSRVRGLMGARSALRRFLSTLAPSDRVAIALYEHHLSVPLDFTFDRERVLAYVDDIPLVRRESPIAAGEPPSLQAGLDAGLCREAASPERAIELLGRALEGLPGAKSMIMLGFGLGEWNAATGFQTAPGYPEAVDALSRARVSVFALDVTQADRHSLEAGLSTVASDTGGLYVKTFDNPESAFRQIASAVLGHYVLALVRPPLPKGHHRLSVRLVSPARGTVLARPYIDS
jgi:VWFA-related protein